MPSEISPGNSSIRVMVVDDSAFMRFTITKYLNEIPGIIVVATGHDGKEALDLIPRIKPDVVTLDVEMPHMDGLSTLREIMKNFPLPVIMVSSMTSEGTTETIQALTLGAVDFVAKPAFKANINSILKDVAEKVIRASKIKVFSLQKNNKFDQPRAEPVLGQKQTHPLLSGEKIVVIGSSTGGPRALNSVIPNLPKNLPASVLVIQHMPAGFTRSLAERLDSTSHISVKEAEPGDGLESGRCLIAPGGFHMLLGPNGQITLNQNPPVHGVRPAVDVTMISVVQKYTKNVVAVILTGMGSDGTNGAALVHSSGGWVIAESEETSVVWGMPRSVVEAGVADEVLPLHEITKAITRAVES
jgi:two-component system, chemotaxis family, protein-glutamate methylesterase/glutaminase